jgi:hypothetical protein
MEEGIELDDWNEHLKGVKQGTGGKNTPIATIGDKSDKQAKNLSLKYSKNLQ